VVRADVGGRHNRGTRGVINNPSKELRESEVRSQCSKEATLGPPQESKVWAVPWTAIRAGL